MTTYHPHTEVPKQDDVAVNDLYRYQYFDDVPIYPDVPLPMWAVVASLTAMAFVLAVALVDWGSIGPTLW